VSLANIAFFRIAWTPQFASTTWVTPKSTATGISEIAEVVDVDGKRVDFKVSARDGIEEIGSEKQRIVIDLCSFSERLAKKRSY
jgi:predicted thioesterase